MIFGPLETSQTLLFCHLRLSSGLAAPQSVLQQPSSHCAWCDSWTHHCLVPLRCQLHPCPSTVFQAEPDEGSHLTWRALLLPPLAFPRLQRLFLYPASYICKNTCFSTANLLRDLSLRFSLVMEVEYQMALLFSQVSNHVDNRMICTSLLRAFIPNLMIYTINNDISR